jgi:hypothetical protein
MVTKKKGLHAPANSKVLILGLSEHDEDSIRNS